MKIKILTSILILTSLNLFSTDMRDIVKSPEDFETPMNDAINPDGYIYGVKFNWTEDEVIKKLGSPDGYYRFNKNVTGMMYEKNKMYLFRKGKLNAFRVAHSIIDYRILRYADESKDYSYMMEIWSVEPGLKKDMKLPEVRKVLGKRFIESDSKYHASYETRDAIVKLAFSSRQGIDGDEAFTLGSLFIIKKDSPKSDISI